MNLLTRVFRSSLGKKYLMAISGLALFAFVVGHLLGNLQIFLGPEKINAYGYFLHSSPGLLWSARLGLLLLAGIHIWSAIKLTAENKAARPVAYANPRPPVVATYASRTMMMSGLIVFFFVLYHLLHFTVQAPAINFTGQDFHQMVDAQQRHDVYRMMITGFSNKLVSIFYVISIALLSLHLSHGLSAMFQSLGFKNRSYGPLIDGFARGVAFLIFLGYASIPLAVITRFVK
jgi:succinate dehydrogenase / fumarate reductase cytochrome b subunit